MKNQEKNVFFLLLLLSVILLGGAAVYPPLLQSAKNNVVVAQPSSPSAAQLRVFTEVINDDGIGTSVAEDFSIFIANADATEAVTDPLPGAPPPDGRTFDLVPGTYKVLGGPVSEYSITFEGDCDTNGTVTVAADEEPPKTCTVIFDDAIPGSIRVVTDVINDNNGTLQANDFVFNIIFPEFVTATIFGRPPPDGVTIITALIDRPFTVEQDPVPGYDTTLEGDCSNVAVVPNQIKTCTIINNDVAPLPVSPPTAPANLNVFINVINDNGGNKTAEDFTIRLTAADGTEVAPSPTMAPPSTIFFGSLSPGTYIVTHDPVPDYTTTFEPQCDSAGQITVLVGTDVECEVTFDDIAPPTPPGVSPPPVEDDQAIVTDELVPTQSEAGLCDDGIDNDQDGRVDLQDEDCEQEEEQQQLVPPPPPPLQDAEEEEELEEEEEVEEEAQERLEEAQERLEEELEEEDEEPQAPVAITGDNIYIAWWTNNTENGNEEVMFRASTDDGATFGDKINLSNTTDADSNRVEIHGEEDTVVVSWWETTTTTTITNQTTNQTAATTTAGATANQTEGAAAPESVPVMRVSNDAGETFGPVLMLATNGTIGVTEEEEEGEGAAEGEAVGGEEVAE